MSKLEDDEIEYRRRSIPVSRRLWDSLLIVFVIAYVSYLYLTNQTDHALVFLASGATFLIVGFALDYLIFRRRN